MAIDLAIRILWTAVGIAIMWLAWSLGVGKLDEPGPGLMSFGLGALITIVGFSRVLSHLVLKNFSEIEPWTKVAVGRVSAVVLLLIVYIALFEQVGFIVMTFALLLVLFAGFAGIRWTWSAALAAVLSLGNYVLFKVLLGTQLPAGVFG